MASLIKRKKYDLSKIQKYYLRYGCELISESFINFKIPLKYRCHCGEIAESSFDSFKSSKYKSCKCCARKKTKKPSPVKIGQRFGKLVVLRPAAQNKWGQSQSVCVCDCGIEKIVLNNCLKKGDTKTCGNCKPVKTSLINLKGKTFGSLKVLQIKGKNKDGLSIWECLCSCGEIVCMDSRRLRSAEYPSCNNKGCHGFFLKKEKLHKKRYGYCRLDLIGARFGKIKVKEVNYENNDCSCVCDCGNKFVISLHKLSELGVTDCGCVVAMNNTEFNPIELDLVLGTLLGDGCLSKSKNFSRLRILHSTQQKELVNWKYDILKRFVRTPPKEYPNPGYNKLSRCERFNTICTKELSEIHKILYPSGIKKITEQYLSMITHPIALAVWYMDDGSCNKSNNSCYISTESFSIEEVQILSNWLKTKWEINGVNPYSYTKKGKEYIRLSFKAKARDQFFDLIRRYVIPSMNYKLSQPKKPFKINSNGRYIIHGSK